MLFTPLVDPLTLRVQVYDQDRDADELIGSQIVSLIQENTTSGSSGNETEDEQGTPKSHSEKLLAAYDETSQGQGSAASDQTVGHVLEDICIAVEEVIQTQHDEIKAGNDWSTCEWYSLMDDKGRKVGAVRLFMRWAVPLPPTAPKEWQLLTTVVECKELKSMEHVGKNDVFVRVHAWGTENGDERTVTIKDGGASPRWGAELPGKSVSSLQLLVMCRHLLRDGL